MVAKVQERERHASPGGRPQPIAFDRGTLWIGCRDTKQLYGIDPKTWSVLESVALPGEPFGLTAFDGTLLLVLSLGDDDDRYFYRYVPGRGLDLESKMPCPNLTGSHLASDGTTLYLAQMTDGRILEIGADGDVRREIALPTRCAGMGFGESTFHIIAADEEFEDLRFGTFDLRAADPKVEVVAALPEEARGLAFDGTAWWTNLRDISQILSFA